MYMHGLRLASNIIVHTYKRRDNRMYVNLSDDGRSWEYGGEQGYKELLRTVWKKSPAKKVARNKNRQFKHLRYFMGN